jgi:glucokinase
MDEKFIAGIDIGGTWVRVAICSKDLEEETIRRKIARTVKENKYSISSMVCQLLTELLDELKINKTQLLGIGVATAGPLNVETGEVFNNANLGCRVIPLKEPIETTFPEIPLYFINDCNGAVLGVHYFEAEEDEKENLVYITMSTGIGGGVICNGHLLYGKEGNAAEIGHGKVEPRSTFRCNCGANGCWEVFSSGTGVQNRTLDAINDNQLNYDILMKIIENDISMITAKEVFRAAREGDELSSKIVEDCIFYSKIGIGLVNNFYDCTTIYFGGAMMKDKAQIFPPLVDQFEKEPIEFTVNNPPKLKLTKFGDEIGLLGALALVKYKLEKNQIIL